MQFAYWQTIKEECFVAILAFLSAINRFWSNRFNKEVSEEVFYLRSELALSQKKYEALVEKVLAKPAQEEYPVVEQEELRPLSKPHWRVAAAELTRQSIQKRREMDASKLENQQKQTITPKIPVDSNPVTEESTIEALEEELGINETGTH